LGGAAAIAILTAVASMGAPQDAAPQTAAPKEKTVKNEEEYNISNQTFKDYTGKNWKQLLTDVDTWREKFPDSDWKDDREFLYLQGLFYSQQFDKTDQFGGQLMDKDLASMFKSNQGNILAIYYMVTTAAAQLIGHNATPDQIAIGDKAAHKLLDFATKYFVPAIRADRSHHDRGCQRIPVAGRSPARLGCDGQERLPRGGGGIRQGSRR
jgi:hypothetical protein